MREHLRKADTAWLQGDEHEAMDLIDFVVSVGLREIARQRQQKGTRNADSRQR